MSRVNSVSGNERPLAARTVEAVFFDGGGPVYDDENFVTAVLAALDGLRAEQGRAPVDRVRFRAVYDSCRAAHSGSLRLLLGTGVAQPDRTSTP